MHTTLNVVTSYIQQYRHAYNTQYYIFIHTTLNTISSYIQHSSCIQHSILYLHTYNIIFVHTTFDTISSYIQHSTISPYIQHIILLHNTYYTLYCNVISQWHTYLKIPNTMNTTLNTVTSYNTQHCNNTYYTQYCNAIDTLRLLTPYTLHSIITSSESLEATFEEAS